MMCIWLQFVKTNGKERTMKTKKRSENNLDGVEFCRTALKKLANDVCGVRTRRGSTASRAVASQFAGLLDSVSEREWKRFRANPKESYHKYIAGLCEEVQHWIDCRTEFAVSTAE